MVDHFAVARANMVDCQVSTSGVVDRRILDGLRFVPRENFVPESWRSLAYFEGNIPVGISHSSETRYLMNAASFARLVQLADIRSGDTVLDIGSATGYSSAVLSRLGRAVVALEDHVSLTCSASENLSAAGVDNVMTVTGLLENGYAPEGPYDVILLEGMIGCVPEALFAQCKDGGRIVAMIYQDGVGLGTVFHRHGDVVSHRYAFDGWVPFLSGFGNPGSAG